MDMMDDYVNMFCILTIFMVFMFNYIVLTYNEDKVERANEIFTRRCERSRN